MFTYLLHLRHIRVQNIHSTYIHIGESGAECQPQIQVTFDRVYKFNCTTYAGSVNGVLMGVVLALRIRLYCIQKSSYHSLCKHTQKNLFALCNKSKDKKYWHNKINKIFVGN